ncbi:MAG TPA: hypothetical protein VM261_23185 [Kofleriaceae bacterium]|nr:hypothetical protein [Kofleriaceae bacterium]
MRAKGVGPADRHAPSPAVARVASRRAAEVQARGKLTRAVRAMKLAGGGTVGDAVEKDKDAAARLAAEIERAVVIESDLITDGSSRVTMSVGIEAVRQALSGVRTVSGEDTSAVWIVEAKRAAPAVGWKVQVGGTSWEGPILWTRERADIVGTGAVNAKATSATGGVLTVSGPTAPPPAGALVVVVVPEK